jgi:regulator of RNase E activity RraA
MGGSIQSVTPTLGPTVGVAVTCEMDSSTPRGEPDMAGYWQQLQQMQDAGVPAIWVVKCVGSRPDHECVIGDGMAKTLRSVGCVGLVTDGGVRDLPGLLNTSFAAYARGVTIHHTALRVRRLNRPVKVGGITVAPGDVLHANAEGVIKIPRACLPVLAARAVQMRAFEHEAHIMWRRTDLSLESKRAGVGALVEKYGFADCVTPAPAKKRKSRS